MAPDIDKGGLVDPVTTRAVKFLLLPLLIFYFGKFEFIEYV